MLSSLQRTAGSNTQTYHFTYDSFGNTTSIKVGSTANGHTYTYGNTNWRDLLTAFDGETITYDAIGNPTSYYNGTRWTFGWSNGRQLTSASNGTSSITYTYTADGMRTSKVVDGVTYNYYYASGKLLRQFWGSNTLDFFYDASGTPYALKHNGTLYYYITNLQGDVLHLIDGSGNIAATYQYDPYGNVLTATGTIAAINPLRYRGYVYDTETGLYYLQSRYYDPSLGRFLNADSYASTGQGILGNNMFAYCRNNPVSRKDAAGTDDVSCTTGEDNNPFNDLGELPGQGSGGGAGGGNFWGSFTRTLQSAADGLNMAMGQRNMTVAENHHIFSNKNKTYTPQYKEITDRYNMSLNARENIVSLQGHSGRHTITYHNFMLSALTDLNSIANGNPTIFFEGMAIIRGFIRQNPGLPYAK